MMTNRLIIAIAAAALLFGCEKQNENLAQEKQGPTFLELAKARYSVRYYAKTPVEQEKIDAILEAARIAPTAKNQQPFHIYALTSKKSLAKINELTRSAYEAPVVFIVCYDKNAQWTNPLDPRVKSGEMDASIVGTHMMLEAAEQGLGSCWVKFFNPKEVAAAFEIPDNLAVSFLLDVGYPAKGAAPNKMHFEKRDIKDFTTYK